MAIVGAGIAGLTLAAALTRAGIRCDVHEQTRKLRAVGAGVQVAPNASRLLHRLGAQEALRRAAVRPAAIEMRRWDDGGVLARTGLGDECERRFGAPYYTLHRADLHSALLALVPRERVRLGRRCVGVEEEADEVRLRFADGATATADVAVGADGIHSPVRDALVADEPRSSGQAIYRGLVPAERAGGLADAPAVSLWLGPGQHAVCYPVSQGRLVSFAATVPSAEAGGESWSAEGDVDEVLAAYQGWSPRLRGLIAAAGGVGRWLLHDRPAVERWSTGRVTIMGDAAHPMLPFRAQGANMAIEDACALAACLSESGPGGVASALRRYASVRGPRTSEVQEISRRNTGFLHLADGEEQRRRDAELRARAGLDGQAWLFDHDAEASVAMAPA